MPDQQLRFECRRRHVRTNVSSSPVTVKDQAGHLSTGAVLDISVGGVALYTESLPCSPLLEIQPQGSPLWVKVISKNTTPAARGYILGCAFHLPPTGEILKALSGVRQQHRSA